MTDSARTEEIRARVEKATPEPWELRSSVPYGDGKTVFHGRFDKNYTVLTWPWRYGNMDADAEFIAHARSDVPYLLTELAALREEVERLKGALKAATHCPTCEGTGKMTLECMACLSGEPGARCTCAEETCAQCDGRGWATADGTGEELVAAALSPSPAQQETVPKQDSPTPK